MTGHLELLNRLADHEDVPPALLIGTAVLVFVHLACTVLAMLTSGLLVRIAARYA